MAQKVQSAGETKYPFVISVSIYDIAHAPIAQKYGFMRISENFRVSGVCFDKNHIFTALMQRSQTNVPIGIPYTFTLGLPTRT